jgi:hypothetical protein
MSSTLIFSNSFLLLVAWRDLEALADYDQAPTPAVIDPQSSLQKAIEALTVATVEASKGLQNVVQKPSDFNRVFHPKWADELKDQGRQLKEANLDSGTFIEGKLVKPKPSPPPPPPLLAAPPPPPPMHSTCAAVTPAGHVHTELPSIVKRSNAIVYGA